MPTKIQLRRDTAADWTSNNPTLAAGEFGWESDTNRFKIGDGATAWTSLGYASDGDTAGITFVGDDSTGTLVSQNETFKIAGGTGITTAVSGDTLTITASGGGGATGLTFVGDDSTGTLIGDGETVKIAGGTGITTAMSGDTLTITASGGGGTITALNNQAENRITTIGSTTTELDGEANLTFDGSTLTLTGTAALDGVTITDNEITTNRSNDNLNITANGSGYISLGPDFDAISTSGRYNHGVTRTFTGNISGTTQMYPNSDGMLITLTGDLTGSGRMRSERRQRVDLAGFDITGSSTEFLSSGLTGFTINPFLENNSATASTATEMTGYSTQTTIQANSGDISLTNMVSNAAISYISANTGLTGAVTNGYGYVSWGVKNDGGAGTKSLTNYYHYAVKANGNPITPSGSEYGFYVDDTAMANYIGGVTLQNGAISTDGITINDNEITTSRSNDNLNISANGTGRLVISANGSRYESADSDNPRNVGYHEDTAATFGTRATANLWIGVYKIDSGQSNSTSSNDRWRNIQTIDLDLNGKSSTATSTALTRGPQNVQRVYVRNSGGADVTLGNVNGGQNYVAFSLQNTHDMTVTEAAGHSTSIEFNLNSGRTLTLPNAYGYHSSGVISSGGAGTLSGTNFTHFYAQKNGASVTNEYGFYAEDGMLSRFGAVILGNLGSDPATVADSAHIYAKDDAGSSEVYVRDEAGNVTKISPHNTAGEWEYYSVNKNTGKTVRINMEALVREVEQLSGKKFIENE